MKKLAIFASGNGTNAQNIVEYFRDDPKAEVVLILTNNPGAGVLRRAEKSGVPVMVFDREQLYATGEVLRKLEEHDIDLVVLAGFLWRVPEDILGRFRDRIVNIHPALLPKYGGKGMYGDRVHEAVKASGDKETGITIHYVNENYDEGRIIFQAGCSVEEDDTPDDIAGKVHELEYRFFPKVIGEVLQQLDR